jgi:hypothetical protein
MKSLEKHRKHLATVTNLVLITEKKTTKTNNNEEEEESQAPQTQNKTLVKIQCTTKLQITPRHAAFPTDPQQNTETYRACPQKTGKTKTRSTRSEETNNTTVDLEEEEKES